MVYLNPDDKMATILLSVHLASLFKWLTNLVETVEFRYFVRDAKRNVSVLLNATNLVNSETNLEKASPTEKL